MSVYYTIKAQRIGRDGERVGKILTYDGEHFSSDKPPRGFASKADAIARGREMVKNFDVLNGYAVYIQDHIARENPKKRAAKKKSRTSKQKTSVPRTARSNPRAPRESAQLDEAARKFADFTGHTPTRVTRHTKRPTRVAWELGPLDFVGYTAVRDGKREAYIHKFKRRAKPVLAASANGKQLEIVGGRYEVTEAGIEDR